jgi:predicted Zn-dependent peptidase
MNTSRSLTGFSFAFLTLLMTITPNRADSQSLEDFEEKTTEFTLENGMKFIVVERHDVPIVSFQTYTDVGSVDEDSGATGLAHMFEHMAFKGTTSIGTMDLEKEMKAMEKEDKIFEDIRRLRQRPDVDPEEIERLEADLKAAMEESRNFIRQNELDRLLKEAGATGLNASTSADATRYYLNLPSNKVELWFAIESDRFLNPVLREFHAERLVVKEERRMRTDNDPLGALLEEFRAAAFKAHPYGQPVIGHMSDIANLSREDAREFFQEYYVPSNMLSVIVGDVDPDHIKELAKTYFGRLPTRDMPEPVTTVEPEQIVEREVIMHGGAQPIYVVGYHIPGINHPDAPVYEVMADILGRGRASRLYHDLVKDKQVATSTGAFTGYPGEKYPNLMVFYSFASKGHTAEDSHELIMEEIEDLKSNPVSPEELKKAQTRAKANLLRGLESNSDIATMLAGYQMLTGDWRNLFKNLDKINAVTAADIQELARKTFVPDNRTIAYIKADAPEPVEAGPQQTQGEPAAAAEPPANAAPAEAAATQG